MNPLLESYIERHIEPEPANLDRLERETNLRRVNGRMCSGHIQGRLLKMLTGMIKPRRVLELGTFTGYSALCIAEGLDPDANVITVEVDEELEPVILQALAESPFGHRVTLLTGDAAEVCERFEEGSFDMVFIDADKREYPAYYQIAKRLVRPGGYILADNTLWDGHVIEEHTRDRQTLGVMEFNRLAAEDPETEVAIIPVRDGISVIRKL